MGEDKVVIQVFHGADGNCATCSGGCQASGQGVRAATEQIAAELKERYGETVQMDYVDIFMVNLNDYPRVIAALRRGFEMPIITFNGHPKLSAAINKEDIEEVLGEMGL